MRDDLPILELEIEDIFLEVEYVVLSETLEFLEQQLILYLQL